MFFFQTINKMRTTLDIDDPTLQNLKQLREKQDKSMGLLVSDLLAQTLRADAELVAGPPPVWISRPMGARVDFGDEAALYRADVGKWPLHSCLQAR